ncbi:AraC family transcriptional regulator [Bradyrhizobium guangdongense]|uniref:AraC family transcriptional regulator n=1 Tax=Bradyrhizobium guangdongense TaxID=1325090 RepID=UPI001FF01CF6|nr:helix-turn-helix domain-containing protein [Bradyrhizobium guangdongense]
MFVLQRSFARRLEADLGTDQGLGLFIPISFHCSINGRTVDNSTIGIMRGKIPVEVVEQHPNTYLMLRFNSDMGHRGWPEEDGLHYVTLPDGVLRGLRACILDMFCLAAASTDVRQFEALNRPYQETLIAGLDSALAPDGALRTPPRSRMKHRRLIESLDELVATSSSKPLYGDDLAAALGVSVRTLHTAAYAVHGVSLHRYVKQKQMWAVRRQLSGGYPGLTVKSVALAHGFWHMGEFSKAYRDLFGELPSQTLARGRV